MSYKTYTESMKRFLELYKDENQLDQMNYEDCGGKYESQVDRGALIQIGPFGVVRFLSSSAQVRAPKNKALCCLFTWGFRVMCSYS